MCSNFEGGVNNLGGPIEPSLRASSPCTQHAAQRTEGTRRQSSAGGAPADANNRNPVRPPPRHPTATTTYNFRPRSRWHVAEVGSEGDRCVARGGRARRRRVTGVHACARECGTGHEGTWRLGAQRSIFNSPAPHAASPRHASVAAATVSVNARHSRSPRRGRSVLRAIARGRRRG